MSRHPEPTDLAIVIEVSDSTLDRDRDTKQRIYARAGIAEYWIVNINERQIEIYTQPESNAVEPSYRNRADFSIADIVPFVIDGKRIGEVAVQMVLP